MKIKSIIFFALGVSICFFARAETPCGPTENCVETLPATVGASCAPWDGPAVYVTLGYEGKIFTAQVWGRGVDRLSQGKNVVLDGKSASNGTGRANLCDSSNTGCQAYASGDVAVKVPKNIEQALAPERGTVTIQGNVIPITAAWDPKKSFCG